MDKVPDAVPAATASKVEQWGLAGAAEGPMPLGASGLPTLLFGVLVAAGSPARSRRHRSRPPGFEPHTAWKRAATPNRGVSGDEEESVMGAVKKAKHEAKKAKSKSKKDAGKVKHKGKKAKNAAKH